MLLLIQDLGGWQLRNTAWVKRPVLLLSNEQKYDVTPYPILSLSRGVVTVSARGFPLYSSRKLFFQWVSCPPLNP
jgi:hypothetical protein